MACRLDLELLKLLQEGVYAKNERKVKEYTIYIMGVFADMCSIHPQDME